MPVGSASALRERIGRREPPHARPLGRPQVPGHPFRTSPVRSLRRRFRSDEPLRAAVEALVKKSNCLKCHAVDKKKEGPAFRDTAAKYKDKADAEAKLVSFLTTSSKVKIDGRDESHHSLKTKNDADVKDAVRWILSR